jgi:HEAT repeat protein
MPALLRLAGADTVPCLVKYLEDPKNSSDRKNVVLHLGRSKDPRAVVVVAKELDSDNKHAAREAVKAMGSMAEKEVCRFLAHEEASLRSDAARLLEIIGTQESVAALKNVLNDKHPTVKSCAKKALQRIADRAK